MKQKVVDMLPLPLHILTSHECENCGYEFIILSRLAGNVAWASIGRVEFCPKCGATQQNMHPTGGSLPPSEHFSTPKGMPTPKVNLVPPTSG